MTVSSTIFLPRIPGIADLPSRPGGCHELWGTGARQGRHPTASCLAIYMDVCPRRFSLGHALALIRSIRACENSIPVWYAGQRSRRSWRNAISSKASVDDAAGLCGRGPSPLPLMAVASLAGAAQSPNQAKAATDAALLRYGCGERCGKSTATNMRPYSSGLNHHALRASLCRRYSHWRSGRPLDICNSLSRAIAKLSPAGLAWLDQQWMFVFVRQAALRNR